MFQKMRRILVWLDAERKWVVVIMAVKCHTTEQDVAEGKIEARAWKGNDIADHFANEGALRSINCPHQLERPTNGLHHGLAHSVQADLHCDHHVGHN